MSPVIALLTDFGTRDYYVAAMKAVILSIAPACALVDITHDIPAQDIAAASFELNACYRDFPPGTVFLVVVDPGVGTSRRAIAARAVDYSFVAPDNGVLSPALEQHDVAVVELTERRFARPTISSTFEGRDLFAPAAAWLARGTGIEELGHPVTDAVRLATPMPKRSGDTLEGTVVKVDRFGNLVSNITHALVESLGRPPCRVQVDKREVAKFVRTYGDVPEGQICALIGSSGLVEVSVNGGSAAETLGAGRGASVTVFA